MAFVNLPPNLKDMFYSLSDRIAKLETQPNQAMYTAVEANASAAQGMAEAQAAYAIGIQAQTQATQALIQAQSAYALGSQALIKDSNTITNSSNNLTGINGNGITVYSGTSSNSGARVVLNSAGLAGFNSAGTATFSIAANTGAVSTNGALFTSSTISGGSLNINGNAIIDTNGFLTASGATITGTITSNNATITGGSLTVGSNFQVNSLGTLTATNANLSGTVTANAGTIGGWSLAAGKIYSGTSELRASDGAAVLGNITGFGTITNYGPINTSGTGANIFSAGNITSTNSIQSGTFLRAITNVYAEGHATTSSAANCFIQASDGRLYRSTASSEKYKHDIVDLIDVPELNPKKLYDLPVHAFRLNDGYLDADDDRNEALMPGFIAEEVDAIYPIASDYASGMVESWNDRIILPAMLALIQDQNKRITELENKLSNL